jgi:hypothetical protein
MTQGEVYQQALQAISLGHPLLTLRPTDAADFCPPYLTLNESKRRVFWANFLTAIAEHESYFDPMALLWEGAKDPEYSIGLLQISPSNKRPYNCDFQSESELTDPAHNLGCGVAILTKLVQQSNLIGGADARTGKSGAAKYWSTLRIVSEKPRTAAAADTRSRIVEYTSTSAPCAEGRN